VSARFVGIGPFQWLLVFNPPSHCGFGTPLTVISYSFDGFIPHGLGTLPPARASNVKNTTLKLVETISSRAIQQHGGSPQQTFHVWSLFLVSDASFNVCP